jgi:outer membrane protein assembly factor BamB
MIDGKLYLGDEDGDIVILQEGKTKKVISEINMASSVYSTPVPANGTLFIANRNQLYAIAEQKPQAAPPVKKPEEPKKP